MAILKIKEIRAMSAEQMDEKLSELGTELSKMRSQKRSGGAPENTGKMRTIRRTIARIETVKNEKARGVKIGPKKESPKVEKAEKVLNPVAKKQEKKPAKAAPKKTKAKK